MSCRLLTIIKSFQLALIFSSRIHNPFFHLGQGSLNVQPPIRYRTDNLRSGTKNLEVKEPKKPALELFRKSMSGCHDFISFLSSKTAFMSFQRLISLVRCFSWKVVAPSFFKASSKGYSSIFNFWFPTLFCGPAATKISYLSLFRRGIRV